MVQLMCFRRITHNDSNMVSYQLLATFLSRYTELRAGGNALN
jgi:hypothetical protein